MESGTRKRRQVKRRRLQRSTWETRDGRAREAGVRRIRQVRKRRVHGGRASAVVESGGFWFGLARLGKWSIGAAAVLLVAFGAVAGLKLLFGGDSGEPAFRFGKGKAADENALIVERDLPGVLAGYLGAETMLERLRFARSPRRVAPLMARWYEEHPLESATEFELQEVVAIDRPSDELHIAKVKLPDGRVKTVTAVLAGGEVKIDWETTEGYAEFDSHGFRLARPTEAVTMRVIVERCEDYRAPYDDRVRYQAYRVLSRDGSRTDYYAYCRRGSTDAELLRMRAEVVGGPFDCMLRLRYRDETVPPETVEIVEFLQDGWIVAAAGDE